MAATVFHEYATALLDIALVGEGGTYEFMNSESGVFGFYHRKNYSGLMAVKPNKPKQGLFDIVVLTGNRYDGDVNHKQNWIDLLKHSNVENCLRVWRSSDPRDVGQTTDEKEALTTMSLLMFEQEVNWGKEAWQKGTNFPPYIRNPTKQRPRDMIMGYVRQCFDLGIDRLDEVKYWMKTKPGTVTFNNPDGDNRFFRQYPPECKRFFDELEFMDGTSAVMVGEIRNQFRDLASESRDHNNWRVDEPRKS